VTSDIGAIDPGSWHDWHLAWKIGATSFENVTVRAGAFGACANAVFEAASRPAAARAAQPSRSVVPPIVNSLVKSWRQRATQEKFPGQTGPGRQWHHWRAKTVPNGT
jgi:hypothetical protein